MYYTIYKTTNKINNKYYIGKHKTKDLNDKYLGSGKFLKRAIKKYGLKNFTKEILFVFDSEKEMNDKEKELVVLSEDSYNLCEGGKGGFGYINSILTKKERQKRRKLANQKIFEKYGVNNPSKIDFVKEKIRIKNKGRTHTQATKEKMSVSLSGEKNPMFGTIWITNGTITKKIFKNENLPRGFKLGRKI